MNKVMFSTLASRLVLFGLAVVLTLAPAFSRKHEGSHTSSIFSGKAVNGGTVTHVRENGKSILRLSKDFQIPGSPDPHWKVIDARGETHLLQALKLKEGLSNREIVLPSYVQSVAKVQIWCAFAEVVLGEASFDEPVK